MAQRELPPVRDVEDALSLQRDLAEVFALAPGRHDAESLEDVRLLCQLTRITIGDQVCIGRVALLERHAESFFVVDDDVRWAWHTRRHATRGCAS